MSMGKAKELCEKYAKATEYYDEIIEHRFVEMRSITKKLVNQIAQEILDELEGEKVNGINYSLETVDEKLTHVKTHLYDLRQEQDEKRNAAMAYVLEHLTMIVDNARMQYLDEKEKAKPQENNGR